jgi:regulator of replication initiation timing
MTILEPLSELEALRAENARLREVLRQIVNNAPCEDPDKPRFNHWQIVNVRANYAHGFWIAGQLALRALIGDMTDDPA